MKLYKKAQYLILSLGILLGIGLVLVSAPAVYAQTPTAINDVCVGIGTANGTGNNNCSNSGDTTVGSLIATVINILSILIGATSVIMVIIGGFKFITSNGDSNAASSARNTILYALIGLAVAAFAQLLVHFVLNRATGAVTPCPTNSSITSNDPSCKQ